MYPLYSAVRRLLILWGRVCSACTVSDNGNCPCKKPELCGLPHETHEKKWKIGDFRCQRCSFLLHALLGFMIGEIVEKVHVVCAQCGYHPCATWLQSCGLGGSSCCVPLTPCTVVKSDLRARQNSQEESFVTRGICYSKTHLLGQIRGVFTKCVSGCCSNDTTATRKLRLAT